MQLYDVFMIMVKGWLNGKVFDGGELLGVLMVVIGIIVLVGISMVMLKIVMIYVGGNVDVVVQNYLQYMSGQWINLQVGCGVVMFVYSEGVLVIVNQGKVVLQSQNDDMQIDLVKNIQMMVGGGKFVGMVSEQVVFVMLGGVYLKLQGGDIEFGCLGSFIVKLVLYMWVGLVSMSVDFLKFDQGLLGWVLKLVWVIDGQLVEGMEVEV